MAGKRITFGSGSGSGSASGRNGNTGSGSAEASTAERTEGETLTVSEAKAVGGTTLRRGGKRAKKGDAKECDELAAGILFMASMGACQIAGSLDAAMNESEANAARPPLSRILQNMGGSTVALMQRWADPLLLLQAFAAYGTRVYAVYRAEHPPIPPAAPGGAQRPSPASTGAIPSPRGNGTVAPPGAAGGTFAGMAGF